ncbi:MAG: hypothetical protein WCO60_08555 [Verrucomicrobiota bacterium]
MILFIGNSLTFSQNGIYSHLEKLAVSATPPIAIQTTQSLKGGATLETHWNRPTPQTLIKKGSYDAVVLQEDLPETTVERFHEYARLFIDLIRATNSRPILLMTWPYERLPGINTQGIEDAHRVLQTQLNVEVAPAALAWQHSSNKRPELDLFAPDREHPSLAGTYLTTCVLYATLFRSSPIGNAYIPEGLATVDATDLQTCAWQTYRLWNNHPSAPEGSTAT